MAKRPEDRYPSAGDLGRAALAAAAGREVTASERWVATGAAAGEAPRLMSRERGGLDRRPGAALRARGADAAAGDGSSPVAGAPQGTPALIFALIGAAVGVGVYLVERPGDSGPSPELERLIRRADRICNETRGAFIAAAAGRVETFEQAARQVERQRVDLRGCDAAPATARGSARDRRRVVGLPAPRGCSGPPAAPGQRRRQAGRQPRLPAGAAAARRGAGRHGSRWRGRSGSASAAAAPERPGQPRPRPDGLGGSS